MKFVQTPPVSHHEITRKSFEARASSKSSPAGCWDWTTPVRNSTKKWFISVYLMEKSWENYGLWHVYGLYIIIYLYLNEKSWNIDGKIMGDPLLNQKFNPENHQFLVET